MLATSRKEANSSLSELWRFPREEWVHKRECRSGEGGRVCDWKGDAVVGRGWPSFFRGPEDGRRFFVFLGASPLGLDRGGESGG